MRIHQRGVWCCPSGGAQLVAAVAMICSGCEASDPGAPGTGGPGGPEEMAEPGVDGEGVSILAPSQGPPRPPLLPGEHEPIINVTTKNFRYIDPWYFDLIGLDRDISIELNWWTNGTPYPGQFEIEATTLPNNQTYASEITEHPTLVLPYTPGQSSARVAAYQHGDVVTFVGKLILREQIRPEELGGCGDQMRDLFVGWVRQQKNWETNYQIKYVAETLPAKLEVATCGGLCYWTHYHLRGSRMGTLGPILQVEEVSLSPYDPARSSHSLLFFDETGALLRKVDGQLYFVLPDGDLLVSGAMGNTGEWNLTEWVQAVAPAGVVLWTKSIGGTPPGQVVTTLAGNLIMPWGRWNQNERTGGFPTFDPATGQDVDDTILDRGALCTPTSTATACVARLAEVRARFDAWWQRSWPSYGQWLDGAYRTCNQWGCRTASLTAWLEHGEDLLLELTVDSRSTEGVREDLRRLVFFGAADPESAVERGSLGGAFYRRLTDGRLLVSTSFGTWATVTNRELMNESLVAVGPAGVVAWRRALLGPPALLRKRSSSSGSTGALLADNQLFWTSYYGATSNSLTKTWVDLATGAVLPAPRLRILEGACRPR